MWSPSGYAQQAREFLPLIRDEGYPLACINFYGQEGGIFVMDGITMYPKLGHAWGSDALVLHTKDFKADITMTLQDIWVLDDNHLKELKRFVPIVPIDHDPVPMGIFHKLKFAYKVITYSKFGQSQLEKLGMNSTLIPHTVNTQIFKNYHDKASIRKQLGIPEDMFLFGMVAANKDNPSRKSFQEVMDAFKIFQTRHPDSGLYFHVLLQQQGGFPIDKYAAALKLKNIYNTPPYVQLLKVDKASMAKMYNAMDCLLAPSTNGGFEVPIIEAQACEVPAITTDFTAMKDLVVEGKTGFKVKPRQKRFTNLDSYVAYVDTENLLEKMELVYKADRRSLGRAGRRMVEKEYDTHRVFENKWKPWLKATEEEIYPETAQKTLQK